MKAWHKAAALLAALPLAAAARAAQLDVKPGLWSMTRTVVAHGAPPVNEGRMTPQQRARVEEMIKRREARGPRTQTSDECMTRERLERAPFARFEGEADTCADSVFEHTSTHWRGKSVCTLGKNQRTTEVEVKALSPERVEGTVRTRLSGAGGGMTSQMTFSGKWLGPDCPKRD